MKIEYINNTCDVNGIKQEGEIAIFFKDDKIVHHHDYSDGALELDSIQSLLKSIDVDIDFKSIEPTKKQIKEINSYLSERY